MDRCGPLQETADGPQGNILYLFVPETVTRCKGFDMMGYQMRGNKRTPSNTKGMQRCKSDRG